MDSILSKSFIRPKKEQRRPRAVSEQIQGLTACVAVGKVLSHVFLRHPVHGGLLEGGALLKGGDLFFNLPPEWGSIGGNTVYTAKVALAVISHLNNTNLFLAQ
jgi:hypothetical protein